MYKFAKWNNKLQLLYKLVYKTCTKTLIFNNNIQKKATVCIKEWKKISKRKGLGISWYTRFPLWASNVLVEEQLQVFPINWQGKPFSIHIVEEKWIGPNYVINNEGS